jgi:hypothetical protein
VVAGHFEQVGADRMEPMVLCDPCVRVERSQPF